MTIDPSTERFELPISIAPQDIDELGHVNNVVYLRWVQDVAVAHWRARATSQEQADIVWVVVRHEIDYKTSAKLEDELIARTWVGTATDFQFERLTEIVRVRDRRVLASARTLWCPIRIQTGRPARLNDETRSRFSSNAPTAA